MDNELIAPATADAPATSHAPKAAKRTPKPRAAKPRTQAAPAPAPDPNETVTLTRAQLDELIARVSGSTPAAQTSPVTNVDLVGALKEVVLSTRPAEKITVANRIAHNPMNPANDERKWKLQFFQNFDPISVEDVTVAEYELIPQLKSGLFIRNRQGEPLVEVIIVKRGPQRGIHLRYNSGRKNEKAMELMTYAPSLEIMLRKCIDEARVQAEVRARRRAAGLPEDEDGDE